MRQLARFCIVGMSFLIVASYSAAEETTTRTYQLPGHGAIQLKVPTSWQAQLRQPAEGFPPTIVFTPATGTSFRILLTPMFAVRAGMVMPTPLDVKRNVAMAAEDAKSKAVEKNISINKLQGAAVIGYYFSATDRAPKPGEYKYLTQGMLQVGELAPMFTILTNDGGEKIVKDSLTMLRSITQQK
jgi:hypothetical protein